MLISRLITGWVLIVFGIFLIGLSFKIIWVLIYGLPLFLIGIFILLNNKEDKIEKRKDLKEKEYNK